MFVWDTDRRKLKGNNPLLRYMTRSAMATGLGMCHLNGEADESAGSPGLDVASGRASRVVERG